MPTYEYECKDCQYLWEIEQSINDLPLTTCTKCKKETAQRLISAGTGFILQGSGWARDLYSSK